jgi:hypothetical protein
VTSPPVATALRQIVREFRAKHPSYEDVLGVTGFLALIILRDFMGLKWLEEHVLADPPRTRFLRFEKYGAFYVSGESNEHHLDNSTG